MVPRYAASCIGLLVLCLFQEGLARWRVKALATQQKGATSDLSSGGGGVESAPLGSWR